VAHDVAQADLVDSQVAEDRTLKIYSAAEICQIFSAAFSVVAVADLAKVLT
jgi:hypothetical protein